MKMCTYSIYISKLGYSYYSYALEIYTIYMLVPLLTYILVQHTCTYHVSGEPV